MEIVAFSETPETPDLDPARDEDFEQLVRLHHRELTVYAQALTRDHATARDVVQDAFIIAYEKVHTFDVTRDFASWMRGIVRNKWREWLRKNRRYALTDGEVSMIDADIATWQARRAEGTSDLFTALEDCLGRLPRPLVEVIEVTYFEGCNSEEASARLGLSSPAIRKRLQRAREALKQCLDRKSLSPSPPDIES